MTAPRAEERVTKLVEWVAAVAGPLTAVTAVLYYFGWTRTNAAFRYFGVDPAILELEPVDYLVRAAGPAFTPTVALVLGAAALFAVSRGALWLELACLRHPITFHARVLVLRVPSIVLVYAGVVALWCGVRVALRIPDYLGISATVGLTEPVPAALALAAGSVVLVMGVRLLHLRPPPAEPRLPALSTLPRLLLVATILVATFWATSVYSQRAGEDLASFINDNPGSQAGVTVYSEESLSLWSVAPPGPVSEGERFRYVYTGLRLLTYANERWLLLTGERNANGRLAVVILRDDTDIRVRLNG
jgi:hypothetical protein